MGIFSGIKHKAMEVLLKKQLASLPKEQQEHILGIVKNNPQAMSIFEDIAKRVEEKKKAGVNEMYATLQVTNDPEVQKKLREVFGK